MIMYLVSYVYEDKEDSRVFDRPYIISSLSKSMTLRAGDLRLTGTPASIAVGFNPPKFLNIGDVVECSNSYCL